MNTPEPCRPRGGFTLVETLVAVSLSVVVLALVYASYHSLRQTHALRQRRQGEAVRMLDVLRRMQTDLSGAFPDATPSGETAFTLRPPAAATATGPASDPALELQFVSLVRPADGGLATDAAAARLTYRLGPPDADGLRPLDRILQPLAGPDAARPPATNRLAEAVARWMVECYDGTNWVDRWPAEQAATNAAAGTRPPAAVRVELALPPGPGQRRWTMEAAVPAGIVIRSQLERQGAARETP